MKRSGLLNPALNAAIARLGHTDTFVVADCGLPVPAGVPVIDLAVTLGVPGFDDVLAPVLDEVVVEGAVIATEALAGEAAELMLPMLRCPVTNVTHDQFKNLVARASFVVRTGATVPYANVILRSGVPF